MFFKKKKKYPENAKYQKGDLVNFRYKGELQFGYIEDAYSDGDSILYTIQVGGECPALVYNNYENDIIGLVKVYKN